MTSYADLKQAIQHGAIGLIFRADHQVKMQ